MAARKGTGHHMAKLNPDLVRQVRAWYAEGISGSKILDRIDWMIGSNTLYRCLRRETWKDVE